MAEKDPAALFYIARWLTETAEMDADVRGWYLNLVLHHYDKGSLPTDVEKLALLAGVTMSNFERFKQVLNQVLMQKFTIVENGRMESESIREILKSREAFKDKRSRAGNIGVVIKASKQIGAFRNAKGAAWLKLHLESLSDSDLEKAKDKQVLDGLLTLYINSNRNVGSNDLIKKDGPEPVAGHTAESYKTKFENDYLLDQTAVSENQFNEKQLAEAKTLFWNRKQFDAEMITKDYGDVRKHFLNWAKLNADKIKAGNKDGFSDGDNYSGSESVI